MTRFVPQTLSSTTVAYATDRTWRSATDASQPPTQPPTPDSRPKYISHRPYRAFPQAPK